MARHAEAQAKSLQRRQTKAALRRSHVAALLAEGLNNAEIARRLDVHPATVGTDIAALEAQLADDDAALMARRDLAERVALLALAQLEDLNAQVNARFEPPEQDPPTIPATEEP